MFSRNILSEIDLRVVIRFSFFSSRRFIPFLVLYISGFYRSHNRMFLDLFCFCMALGLLVPFLSSQFRLNSFSSFGMC